MVYEQWGLSSLERIVGKEASSVCFVANYVQVYFDQIVLTCYTLPVVHVISPLPARCLATRIAYTNSLARPWSL
jgi:hypothetical protein